MYFRIDADRETYAELLEEYGELMKNTYEIVKDGKAPKRGMDGQVKAGICQQSNSGHSATS